MDILVTGGSGLIGSNFIRFVLSADSKVPILNLDVLTYAGANDTTRDLSLDFKGRYRLVQGDFADFKLLEPLFDGSGFDGVLKFAAASHVDRSITVHPSSWIITTNFSSRAEARGMAKV